MVVQVFDVLDVMGTDGERVFMEIVEHRQWAKNKMIYSLMFTQLVLKLFNYLAFVNSDDFKKKHSNKSFFICYNSVDQPPKEVRLFLKEQGVELKVRGENG